MLICGVLARPAASERDYPWALLSSGAPRARPTVYSGRGIPGQSPAETLPAVRRSGSQLLAHYAAAVAHANERPRGREHPVPERWVIRLGDDPFVCLGDQCRVHIFSKLAGFIAIEEHLRDRLLPARPRTSSAEGVSGMAIASATWTPAGRVGKT
jgi:hypothetical protein